MDGAMILGLVAPVACTPTLGIFFSSAALSYVFNRNQNMRGYFEDGETGLVGEGLSLDQLTGDGPDGARVAARRDPVEEALAELGVQVGRGAAVEPEVDLAGHGLSLDQLTSDQLIAARREQSSL